MKKLVITLLALSLTSLGWSQLIMVTSHLDGMQEVPMRPTSATGTGVGTLDMSTGMFVFDLSFSGLTSPEVAAHFHAPGPPGVNAPVVIPLPLGSPIHFEGVLDETRQNQLFAGLMYVNVHTTNFPGGEIRGQLVAGSPVPEPSTYGLFGAAALLGGVLYRRRVAKHRLQA